MWYKLSDLFDLQMGKTPSRNNPNYWNSNDYLWVSISDMSGYDKYVSSTKEYISELAVKESGIKTIPANTVIMSFKLSIGKTAITTDSIFSNEAIMAFIDKKTTAIDPEYIFYLFSGKDWDEGSNKAVMGKTLNKVTLSNIEVDIPSLDIQKERVDKLNKISTLIANKKQHLNQLDELVKARFVEMFGDNFGEIVELGNVCDVRDGTHDSPKYHNEGYPLVTSKNICNGKIDFSTCNLIQKEDYDKINKRSKVEIGDILMPMIGTVGNPIIINTNNEFAIKNVALIKFKDNSVILNTFVKALLESDYFGRAVLSKTKGGTQKFISLGDIRKLELNLPPIELQNQFATFVAQVDKSKFALSNELAMGNFYIRLIHDCIMHGSIDL